MKIIILICATLVFNLNVFAQTKLIALSPTRVNSRDVIPVKVEGNESMFNLTSNLQSTGDCFSIEFGNVNLGKCDKFVFEFAEYYQGNRNCPLYYIKRSDGKYLSFQMGGAGYIDLITTPAVIYQKWLISKPPLSSRTPDRYNLILPLAPFKYGYTLKMLDDGKIGFGMGIKHLASEANFFLNATPKKQVSGLKTTD